VRIQSLFVDAGRSIMMNKEVQDHEFTETSTLESGREASDNRGGPEYGHDSKRSMPSIRDRHGSVLFVGETCPSRSTVSVRERETGKRKLQESRQEETLKSEVERLRAVIAELSMENLELKKGRWV
jgi:hypothetical protein